MKTLILAGLAVLLPLAAQEIKPFDVKLGLWETAVKTEVSGVPAMSAIPQIPEETLAKLPPEQRARIEAMMKGRGAGGPGSMTTKVCVTRESLNRGFGQNDKACTYKVLSSSPNKQVVHMECTRGSNKVSGDMILERLDAEHARGTVTMKSADSERQMESKMSFDNKWLSPDCGDVKPAGAK
jgi:hypothetical protein